MKKYIDIEVLLIHTYLLAIYYGYSKKELEKNGTADFWKMSLYYLTGNAKKVWLLNGKFNYRK